MKSLTERISLVIRKPRWNSIKPIPENPELSASPLTEGRRRPGNTNDVFLDAIDSITMLKKDANLQAWIFSNRAQ